MKTLGQLMFESGESSFYQKESGTPEMMSFYYFLCECKGVYGACPSRANYYGVIIGLIDSAYKEQIKAKIDQDSPTKDPEYKDAYALNFCKTAEE